MCDGVWESEREVHLFTPITHVHEGGACWNTKEGVETRKKKKKKKKKKKGVVESTHFFWETGLSKKIII